MRQGLTMVLAMVAAVAASGLASAQEGGQWPDAQAWESADLSQGWSARALLDREVYARAPIGDDVSGIRAVEEAGAGHVDRGESIGELGDLVIGPDGRLRYAIIEGGGLYRLGDARVAVRWDDTLRVGRAAPAPGEPAGSADQSSSVGTASLQLPVAADRLREAGVILPVEEVEECLDCVHVSAFMGSLVTAGGVGFGNVEDVVFSADGEAKAAVVGGAFGYGYNAGPIAVPFVAEAFDPPPPHYRVPYSTAELENFGPFVYPQLNR